MTDQTNAAAAKFQVEFAILMLNVGRTEEANKAFQTALKLLAELIEEEQFAAQEEAWDSADVTRQLREEGRI